MGKSWGERNRLIDDTGPRRQLRYVFDVSDTHMVKGGRTPNLWQLQKEQEEAVLDHLADAYGLEGGDTESLSNALMAVASYMAEENLEEAMEGCSMRLRTVSCMDWTRTVSVSCSGNCIQTVLLYFITPMWY